MNRMRIRVGQIVREFPISPSEESTIADLEDILIQILQDRFAVQRPRTEYLGCNAWDIQVDGVKIGHAKAFIEHVIRSESNTPTFWGGI
jgi:hypothetical protein